MDRSRQKTLLWRLYRREQTQNVRFAGDAGVMRPSGHQGETASRRSGSESARKGEKTCRDLLSCCFTTCLHAFSLFFFFFFLKTKNFQDSFKHGKLNNEP